MSVAKKLALIATGYCVAIGAGMAAAIVNDLLIPDDIQQTSGGMVAFGDMVVFVQVSGFLSLAPTWFLLKLCAEKSLRALLATTLLIGALGPASWLAVRWLAERPDLQSLPQALTGAIGLFAAFVAIPRILLGPVVVLMEAATFLMVRGRPARTVLAAAMLMDLMPLSMYALHMAAAAHRYGAPGAAF